ncbi:MAG TPA: PQQ-binding-like beta-propeller repeat protein [Balneolales bacterium]|nr:PQQ-binding-like beta-propeller repeat protein [Balneolales bacterium]
MPVEEQYSREDRNMMQFRSISWSLVILLLSAIAPAIVGCKTATQETTTSGTTTQPPHHQNAPDWTRFGWDAGRSNAPTGPTGITATNVDSLVRQQVKLDGTVDASAIYLRGIQVNGSTHDVFFVTTTYGKTIAINADDGSVLWSYTPSGYNNWAGTAQITTSTPVADPGHKFIYAASPDGYIQKLSVEDGSVVWRTAITKLPAREKIASALNFFKGHVIATTGGYVGDAPPYQGHVVLIDAGSGTILSVWNSLCSDQSGLLQPSGCPESDSAIWARSGAVVDSATGDIYFATGNGLWDGKTNWGDAVLELDPTGKQLIGNYTPQNTQQLNASDADLGSTAPVLLGHGFIAQGGKDGKIRLLDWPTMEGASPHQGGESQIVSTPSGTDLFTAPAVLRTDTTTWMFAADNGGTEAWKFNNGGQFQSVWKNSNGGTSPIVADGLLYVYGPGGGLRIYKAFTGNQIADLKCGSGHWNSPIIVDGMIALPEGNANRHQTTGVLDIWRLP